MRYHDSFPIINGTNLFQNQLIFNLLCSYLWWAPQWSIDISIIRQHYILSLLIKKIWLHDP